MEQPHLTWGSASHTGQRRENQDRCLAAPPIFAVADGMGGHVAGGAASEAVITQLAGLAGGAATRIDTLRSALEQADRDIRQIGGHDEAAGTTVAGVALVESGGGLYWAVFHVGDSRVYRWSPRSWEQISTDHSVIQELLDGGIISAEQALTHPQRHVVTRALGFGERGEADFTVLPVDGGERFLICSDGVTGEMTDQQMAEVMAANLGPDDIAARLVEAAVVAGGSDNASAVVVHVEGGPSGQDDDDREDLVAATIPRLPQA
jgi:protein phosphatase